MTEPVRAEEVETSVELVRGLVAAQFPQWAGLALAPVEAESTDHDMYRLGEDLAVRLPRRAGAVEAMGKEHLWLPQLAGRLPAPVPLPVASGEAADGYPYPWAVARWIEGAPPRGLVADAEVGRDLGAFVALLHGIEAGEGPRPGAHNFWRGVPLKVRDRNMRERFEWLSDLADIGEVTAVWDEALALPAWDRPPVWIHGDLQGGNMLVREGRLAGVIDWSALGVGDPAGDLSPAWNLFEGPARAAFREAVDVDEATWRRGRAWALIEGVLALSYYRGKNEIIAQAGRRTIDAVLGDWR